MKHQTLEQIRSFAFPLNAYAYLLVQDSEVGDVFNLHYGWFDDQSEPIASAQARATREFLSLLPTAPTRILEVGSGLGTTLSLLLQRGHDASGLTPDGSQIAFMRERYGPGFPVCESRFEDLGTPEKKFDLVLFQESGQYIPVQQLFACAAQQLRPGGRIVMCDEVMMGDSELGESLHSVKQMKEVAEQYGFSLSDEADQSARAAHTVDKILAATSRYRGDLIDLLGISNEQIEALDASNKQYQSKYAAGKYGYMSLCWTLEG